jgi:hypothetical protein
MAGPRRAAAPAREPEEEQSSSPPVKAGARRAEKDAPTGEGVTPLHEGVPDYETYRYGYPMTPGRMFGSGN